MNDALEVSPQPRLRHSHELLALISLSRRLTVCCTVRLQAPLALNLAALKTSSSQVALRGKRGSTTPCNATATCDEADDLLALGGSPKERQLLVKSSEGLSQLGDPFSPPIPLPAHTPHLLVRAAPGGRGIRAHNSGPPADPGRPPRPPQRPQTHPLIPEKAQPLLRGVPEYVPCPPPPCPSPSPWPSPSPCPSPSPVPLAALML